MDTLMKKYQQKYKKVREEMDKWDVLQSRLLSLFTNACDIIQRLQLIQDPEKFATLKCVEGIEDAVLVKQLETLTAIFIAMNKTLEDFEVVVRSLEKLSRDGGQLIQGGSNHSTSKKLQQRIGLNPSVVDFVDGLRVVCEMHQSEYRLKSSIVSALEEVCLKQSGRDCLGGLRQLLVDQPNIPKEEVQMVSDIIFAEEIS